MFHFPSYRPEKGCCDFIFYSILTFPPPTYIPGNQKSLSLLFGDFFYSGKVLGWRKTFFSGKSLKFSAVEKKLFPPSYTFSTFSNVLWR